LAAEFTRPRVASGHTAPRGGSDEFRSEPAPIDVTLTAKFSAPIRGLREEVRSWRNAYFDGLKPPPAYRPKDPVEWRKIEIAERPADERASSGRLFGQV
jgi:hypothetical protein